MKVDAGPVRAHVAALVARGATVRGVAAASGVDSRTVGRLIVDPTTCAAKGGILALDAQRAERLLEVSLTAAEEGEAAQLAATRRPPPKPRRARHAPELIGTPEPVRPRSRHELVDCAVDVAKLHSLPLDAFVARQLDVTLPEAQDLLRQARRDGLLPSSVRPRSTR